MEKMTVRAVDFEVFDECYIFVGNVPTGDDLRSRQTRTRIFEALSSGARSVYMRLKDAWGPSTMNACYEFSDHRDAALRRVEGIIKELEG